MLLSGNPRHPYRILSLLDALRCFGDALLFLFFFWFILILFFLLSGGVTLFFFFLNFLKFIYFSWRLITLQYCSGFCHTLI